MECEHPDMEGLFGAFGDRYETTTVRATNGHVEVSDTDTQGFAQEQVPPFYMDAEVKNAGDGLQEAYEY